ncbi:MAG: nucleoside-diphosphate kinase [Eubacteriales bacterium]|nr:nucleoside-diphosphate kinase [Eubacteriales bacterium]
MIEQSYVMVKPEFANNKQVIAEVKKRLQAKGIVILEESYINYDEKRAKMHYHEHVGKGFYPELEKYITSDKAYGMKVQGENAIAVIRALAGSTKNPEPGTIRYDIPKALGLERRITENVVHSSDSPESAKLELAIFEQLAKEHKNNLER